MKNKSTIILLIILLLVWIGGSTYWYLCKKREHCDQFETNVQTELPKANIIPLAISDGDSFNVTLPDDIHFDYSGSQLTVPTGLTSSFDQLASYLKGNSGKSIVVTGLYTEEEGGAQLGLDRAEMFANYLTINHGIPSEAIKKSYKQVEELSFNDDKTKTYNALDFSFNTKPSGESIDLDALKESLMETHYVYFETGSSIMDITPELHQYATDLKYYTDKVQDSKVSVVGYTDNVGEEESNISLSKARAQSVKSYLIDQKEVLDQVLVSSGKGESNPLTSNETLEGKAKNRRVEIKLTK